MTQLPNASPPRCILHTFGNSKLRLFILCFFYLGRIYAKQWFVSRYNGNSALDCGREATRPCKTINQATSRANDGDVINIDGAGTLRDPYSCEAEPTGTGLVMRSYNTQAYIACESNSFRFSCDVTVNASSVVTLKGLTFVNTSLRIDGCSLKMADCSFMTCSNVGLSLNFARNVTGNVDLDGCSFQSNSAGSLKISGTSLNVTVLNSSFASNKLGNVNDTVLAISAQNEQAQQIGRLTVYFKNITVLQNICPSSSCFEIIAGINGKLALEMYQVTFEDNKSGESILDVQNSSHVKVEMKSTQFKKNVGRAVKLHHGNTLELKIMNGTFAGNKLQRKYSNGGAVFVSGFTQKAFVSLSRSHFSFNTAGNGGACAFVDIFYLMLDVESCHFIQNEAWIAGGAVAVGSYHGFKIEKNASLNIRSSHFCENIVEAYNHTHSNMHDFKSGITEPVGIEGGGAISLYVNQVHNLSLENSTFIGNAAKRTNSGAIQARLITLYTAAVLRNCQFIRNSGKEFSGTLRLTVSTSIFRPQIIIQNSTFIENNGSSFYDIYLSACYVLITSCTIQRNSGGGINFGTVPLNVVLEDSVISDNIKFVFDLYKVTADTSSCHGTTYEFKNTSFLNNKCTGRSSLFRVSLFVSQGSLLFDRSTFRNNFCESGVVKISVRPSALFISVINDSSLTINNTEFHGNSGVSESALTILNVKVISILNSNFTDNFGSTDGSHLRVQMLSSELTIYKTNFYQSKKSQVFLSSREQPYNGFLTVTSLGNISIRESSFVLDPFSVINVNLIFVKGASGVVMNNSVIQTPLSTKLHLHNFTHWELGQTSKQVITSFSLVTESCPVGTYSINRGTSEGFTIKNNVHCLPCPAGGNCTYSLSARPNFWGYPMGNNVHFKLCPQGYCCPVANQSCAYQNKTYLHSGCKGNRTGILCGKCKKDFTETLFSANCLPIKDCTHFWYFIIVFICTSSFAMFLVRKPPVFEIVMKNLTWFLPRHRKKNQNGYNSLESDAKPNSSSSSGLLKSLFYFYQIAGVMTASYYGVSAVIKNNILFPVISLLDFKISVNNDWSICPYPGITPLLKTLSQLAAVTATFLSIPAFYLLHSGLNKLRKRTPVLPPCGPYLGATLEILLLGYSAATGTAMKLRNCVQIQHVSRWFYDAEITCPQWWQDASLAAIVVFLVPFILTLYFASLQLYQGHISAKIFLLACVFPLPYLLLAFIAYVNKVISKSRTGQEMKCKSSIAAYREENDEASRSTVEHSVLEVLTAPFRKPQGDRPGKIHWESVLIGRRFLLIMIGYSLEHAFLRSVCLTILCVVFLLHHMYRKPFVHFRDNLAETVSLTTLIVIGVLNVSLASYYLMGIESSGVQSQYVRIFLLTEAVLLGLIPFLFAVFVSLSLVSQLVRLMIILIKAARRLVLKSESYERIGLLS